MIRKSINGGNAWSSLNEIAFNNIQYTYPYELSVMPDQTLYLYGQGGSLTAQVEKNILNEIGTFLLKSSDVGNTWNNVSNDISRGCGTRFPCSQDQGFGSVYSSRYLTYQSSSNSLLFPVFNYNINGYDPGYMANTMPSFKRLDLGNNSITSIGNPNSLITLNPEDSTIVNNLLLMESNIIYMSVSGKRNQPKYVIRSNDQGSSYQRIFKFPEDEYLSSASITQGGRLLLPIS
jgi:hypothetical protein